MQTDVSFKSSLSNHLYVLRGICIVLMIMGHVIGFNREHGMRQLYQSDLGALGWLHDFVLTFHIPIFLMAAGIAFAVFSRKNVSYQEFLRGKGQKLVVPLVCWSSAYFIFQSVYKGEHFSPLDILKSIILPYEIFWFLHALIFATVLSFLCHKLFQSARPYLAISVVLYLACWFLPSSFKVYFYWNLFYAIGVFVAPLLPAWSAKSKTLPLPVVAPCLLLAAALMVTIKQAISIYDVNAMDAARLVNGSLGFFLMFTLLNLEVSPLPRFKGLEKVNTSVIKCCLYLGKMSMIIYLFHGYFTRSTTILIAKTLGLPNAVLYVLLVSAAGVLGPVLLYELLQSKSKAFVYSTGGSK